MPDPAGRRDAAGPGRRRSGPRSAGAGTTGSDPVPRRAPVGRDPAGRDPAGGDPAGGDPAGQDTGGSDPEGAARELCLRLLTTRPRTRTELADALRRRGVPEAAATAVLARFAEVGLIDDAAFARAWVESRHHSRGLARRALSAELKQRGVSGPDITEAVGALDPEDELATARRLVAKALGASRGRPLPVRVRRLVGLLARKGYPAPVAYRVVREALDQEGADLAEAGADLDDPALTSDDAVTEFG